VYYKIFVIREEIKLTLVNFIYYRPWGLGGTGVPMSRNPKDYEIRSIYNILFIKLIEYRVRLNF